jgi:hypothetical protein
MMFNLISRYETICCRTFAESHETCSHQGIIRSHRAHGSLGQQGNWAP